LINYKGYKEESGNWVYVPKKTFSFEYSIGQLGHGDYSYVDDSRKAFGFEYFADRFKPAFSPDIKLDYSEEVEAAYPKGKQYKDHWGVFELYPSKESLWYRLGRNKGTTGVRAGFNQSYQYTVKKREALSLFYRLKDPFVS